MKGVEHKIRSFDAPARQHEGAVASVVPVVASSKARPTTSTDTQVGRQLGWGRRCESSAFLAEPARRNASPMGFVSKRLQIATCSHNISRRIPVPLVSFVVSLEATARDVLSSTGRRLVVGPLLFQYLDLLLELSNFLLKRSMHEAPTILVPTIYGVAIAPGYSRRIPDLRGRCLFYILCVACFHHASRIYPNDFGTSFRSRTRRGPLCDWDFVEILRVVDVFAAIDPLENLCQAGSGKHQCDCECKHEQLLKLHAARLNDTTPKQNRAVANRPWLREA